MDIRVRIGCRERVTEARDKFGVWRRICDARPYDDRESRVGLQSHPVVYGEDQALDDVRPAVELEPSCRVEVPYGDPFGFVHVPVLEGPEAVRIQRACGLPGGRKARVGLKGLPGRASRPVGGQH